MGVLPLVLGALASMAAPRPDAEIGVSSELRGGVASASTGGDPLPELRLSASPYASASLRTRRWETQFRYSLRANWRIPAPTGGWRPLMYQDASLVSSYRWTRRLTQRLSLLGGIGELDYFGRVGEFESDESTLPAISRRVTFGARVGTDAVVSRRNRLTLDLGANYDGSEAPSHWRLAIADATRTFPLRYTVDAQVSDMVSLSPRSSLIVAVRGDYTELSTGQAFVSASGTLAAQQRFTPRLTATLGGGVVYARRTACLRPGIDSTPYSPAVTLDLSHRTITRRAWELSFSSTARYSSTVDFVRAALVRVGSVGLRGSWSNHREWSSSLGLLASTRTTSGETAGSDGFSGESESIGGDASVLYSPSDRWTYVGGARVDLRGDLLSGDDWDASRLGAWVYIQVQSRLWTTRPMRGGRREARP